jgi:hypothetical protein
LWFVLAIVAAICGGAVIWFLNNCWAPPIEKAIARLPEQSAIRDGTLHWPHREASDLADNSFLAIHVQPGPAPEMASGSDLEFTFGSKEVDLHSLFGHLYIPYPKGWVISLNRAGAQPWWGAWKPVLLAVIGLLTMAALLLSWGCLGLVYAPLVKLVAFYADRQVSWPGAWKSATASLSTAGVLIAAGLVAYGMQELTLPGLLLLFAGHFLVQLICVLGMAMSLLPLPGTAASRNPFHPPPVAEVPPDTGKSK